MERRKVPEPVQHWFLMLLSLQEDFL
jgi:hypothetical protein